MVAHITGPLYWERVGQEGPTLVLLHPLPHDLTCWIYQLARFSRWARCVAIDLPGLGRSPAAQAGLTMSEVAAACWRAADDAAPRGPAIIVGLSVGAVTAKHMASQRPEQVRALVLTGGGYYGAGRPDLPVAKGIAPLHVPRYRGAGLAYRREHFSRNFTNGFVGSAIYRYLIDVALARGGDAEGIVRLLLALDEPDPPGLHSGIRAPTLIVTGGEDRSRGAQEEMARRIAGAELRVIDGAGHCCNLERPAEYDRHVLGFLAGLRLLPGDAVPEARPTELRARPRGSD